MRRRIAHLLSAVILAAGIATVVRTMPAHAVNGLYDVCESGGESDCWRAEGTLALNNVDAWPRDISGDTLQRFTPSYVGAVSSTWPYTNQSFDNAEKGDGVYIFEFANSQAPPNSCAVGTTNNENAFLNIQNCGATGHLFVWQPNGCIVNVYESDVAGVLLSVYNEGSYTPLLLYKCTTWVTIDPPVIGH
jgi:hypothetical protein